MLTGSWFERVVGAVARRPVLPLAAVAVIAVVGALLALRLEPQTGTDTLVSSDSSTSKATDRFKQDFGDDAIVVLVKGDLRSTLLTADLGRLIGLEGCLAGTTPKQELGNLPLECRELAELKPAAAVFGPGTFVNSMAGEIGDELTRRQRRAERRARRAEQRAREASADRGEPPEEQQRVAKEAREKVTSAFERELFGLALRYGITAPPTVDSSAFVSSLVFEGESARPKARFAYLFPSSRAALIQMRLRPDLTEAERGRTIDLVREATQDPRFRPEQGAGYVVTGIPVVVDGLGDAVSGAVPWLLAAAILIMAATLGVVFRTRLRLLPLALALAASAITFGVLSLVGGGLTMASIAVLPVLIGLAVDYAIQFQARYDEVRRWSGDPPAVAAPAAAAAGGPTIATAGLATAIGFLILLASPVPMVRGFGALLVVGIVIALACTLLAGFAALVRFGGSRPERTDVPPMLPRVRARLGEWWSALTRSRVGQISADRTRSLRIGAIERSERALANAVARPGRVLAIALVLAVAGWAADTQSTVVSDIQELVPRDLRELEDVNELQAATGVSGEVDVTVRADDVTRPAVLAWMGRFQRRVLEDAGYVDGARCSQAEDPPELCPALSLTDLLGAASDGSRRETEALLDAVPEYLTQGVMTPDRKTANLAFGIRLQPLESQKEVVDRVRDRLDPPPGVDADVVGLPVLAADANAQLSSPWRRVLTLLAALGGVFLVLLAAWRSARNALVPLVPIALATGWAAGMVFLLGLLPEPLKVELNPMSVTLGALVIAISTEFSVLLSSRYRQERRAGASPSRAIEITYASTGMAVLASGITAIAGFAALMASDIRMLRDFGILTVVDLGISLLGVMIVLPAALVWAERPRPVAAIFQELREAVRSLRTRLRFTPRLPRPSLRGLRPGRRDA